MKRRLSFLVAAILILAAGLSASAQSIPAKLTDEEFWKLSTESSEPDGRFRSDNLLSNETWFQYVIPELNQVAKQGRIYLGVGPEQNFTYIAALHPKMAFIIDIRRGNLDLQLMYKALFELSADRGDFVSRLFSKPRPPDVGAQSTATEMFASFAKVEASETLYRQNLKAILEHLGSRHAFPLSSGDADGITYVFTAFYRFGPEIDYSSSGGGRGFGRVNYSELMSATDEAGVPRSYLANEENFKVLKDLETKNLVVPVVGNFSGPAAIRAVAHYLKGIGATVSAFYLSNVEQYLRQDGTLRDFCANAATLPVDETSMFISSVRGGRFGQGTGLNSDLERMMVKLQSCAP